MAKTSKQVKALERLTSKLSALRKTLRGEERQMLDAMVLSAQSEITAHAAGVKVSPAVTSGKTAQKSEVATHAASVRGAKADGQTAAKSEVAMHAASVRGAKADAKNMAKSEVAMHAAKVSPAKADAKNMAKSEVAMHAASVRGAKADAKTVAVTDAKSARVVLDAKTGVYGVVVD
jgi:hypothetical protein